MTTLTIADESAITYKGQALTGPITNQAFDEFTHAGITYKTGTQLIKNDVILTTLDMNPQTAYSLPYMIIILLSLGISLAKRCLLPFLIFFVVSTLHAQNATQSGFYASMAMMDLPPIAGKTIVVARTDATGQTFATYTYTPGGNLSVYRSSDFELRVGYSWIENLIQKRDWKQWANAQPVISGQPIPLVPTGGFDENGDPVDLNGNPVDQDGNPLPTQDHSAGGRINNDLPYPSAYGWGMFDPEGNPILGPDGQPIGGVTPTLGPGEGIDINATHDQPFEIKYGPIVEGGWNAESPSGTIDSSPVNGGNGDGGTGVIITPPTGDPLPTPDKPTATDTAGVKQAVDRVGDIIITYGENGRSVANASHRALLDIIEQFKEGNATAKQTQEALENQTEQNTGPNGTYSNGETMPNGTDDFSDTNTINGIVQSIQGISAAVKNMYLNLSQANNPEALIWNIPSPAGTITINLTSYQSIFSTVRLIILAAITIQAYFYSISIVRGAFA